MKEQKRKISLILIAVLTILCFLNSNLFADEATAEEVKTDEAKTEEVKADEAKTEEVKADEAKTEEVKTNETKTKEIKKEEIEQKKFYDASYYYPATIIDVKNSPFLQSEHTYVNALYGFAFDKNGFFVDDRFEDIKTTFYTDFTFVDIFYNNFSNSPTNSYDYMYYSNKNFSNNEYVTIERNQKFVYKGKPIRVIEWTRKPLKYAKYNDKDFTHYALIDIYKSFNEVYTIQINSVSEIKPMDYISRMKFIPVDYCSDVKYASVERKENSKWSDETKKFYEDFSKNERCQIGIFEPTTAANLQHLKSVEGANNIRFNYLLEYYSFYNTLFDRHFKELSDDNRIIEFTYQTSFGPQLIPITNYDILNGKYDAYIERLAKVIKNIDSPVLFRLNNEMNGDWCSYNALHYNRDTRLYQKIWEYFHHKFEEAGANNVVYVFNPNEKSFPNFKWNHYLNYFPKREYVDVIGVTGYNTGSYYRGESWREFKDIYDEFMPEFIARFANFEFYITEFGSSTIGGDRYAWFVNMFEHLNDYGFKLAIYWNGTDWDINKNPARPYRITEDNAVMKLFETYMNEK